MKVRFISVITLWVLAFFFGALHTILASSESDRLPTTPTPHYYENNSISFLGLVEGTEFNLKDQDKISQDRISLGSLPESCFQNAGYNVPDFNRINIEFIRNHREILTTQIFPFHTRW